MKFVEVTLSAGRVQSATLRIIVQRERLRQVFHPAIYYDLKAVFQSKGKDFSAKLVRVDKKRIAIGKDFDPNTGQLKNKDVLLLSKSQAEALVKELHKGVWTIHGVEEKIINSHPKPPFTTSTLQQEAARKLRSSARKTMHTAQRLYEKGLITYMRTDSPFCQRKESMAPEMKLNPALEKNICLIKPEFMLPRLKMPRKRMKPFVLLVLHLLQSMQSGLQLMKTRQSYTI